ncbi:Uncharacterised protein [uncultured Eubacterium sp.]|nr:Uncharacterised protein [uncultured Eubacterium sp.]
MLIPKVKAKEFVKYGFKKCKGVPSDAECYYLCVAKGRKMLFVSNICFDVFDWDKDDPRIHKNPNCKYRDKRDYLDIIYELIKNGMLTSIYSKDEDRLLPEKDVIRVVDSHTNNDETLDNDISCILEEVKGY